MPAGIYKRQFKPLIKKGDKFGRLTAIKFNHRNKSNQCWLFRCDCGNEKVIRAKEVRGGHTKSCGCLNREQAREQARKGINIKHGMHGTRVYNSWAAMKNRCLNENVPNYKNYGGRGITVCQEWKNSFENFYKDMGDRPKNKTLDRINNNKNYCPENCRWSTPKEQQNNTRYNRVITYQGKVQNMKQWAEELNISESAIWGRLKRGWDIEKALNTP